MKNVNDMVQKALEQARKNNLVSVVTFIETTPANFYNEVFGHCDTPEEIIDFIQEVFFT